MLFIQFVLHSPEHTIRNVLRNVVWKLTLTKLRGLVQIKDMTQAPVLAHAAKLRKRLKNDPAHRGTLPLRNSRI